MTHRPFIFIVGFYALGIVVNYFAPLPFAYVCLGIFILLVFAIGFSKREFMATACLLMAIAGLGSIYTQSRKYVGENDIQQIARYYRKKPIRVKGVINSDVQKRDIFGRHKTVFTLDISEVEAKWGWQKREGKLLVNIFNEVDVFYGDYIMVEGKLHRPYNFSTDKNFSYRDYLERRGIRFILSVKKDIEIGVLGRNKGNHLKSLSLRLRNILKNVLSDHLSKNEAGIMGAILLGDRTAIPRPVRTLFVQTGTAHILAISGLHIGIVAALFLIFIKMFPIGRRGQLGLVIFLLIIYAFLTGGRPSVIRATILTVVFLASFIIEREFDTVNALCLAAMIILLINPLNLFDVGFQLSFVCVFSIIFLNSKVTIKNIRKSWGQAVAPIGRFPGRWFSYIGRSFCLSLAIWIGVAGLIAYYFAILTPITILANLIVVPLISIVVALGFGLLFVGAVLPSWAFLFSACLKVVLNVMTGFIYLCDKVPFAYIYVREVSLGYVVAYYVALLVVMIIPWGRIDKSARV